MARGNDRKPLKLQQFLEQNSRQYLLDIVVDKNVLSGTQKTPTNHEGRI